MLNRNKIKYRSSANISGVKKVGYVFIITILLFNTSVLAQSKWHLSTSFKYAGSHNVNSAYNNLFYLAGGVKYVSGKYSLNAILPIIAQNGGMYTQLGMMILRDSGLNHPDSSLSRGHIRGSVVDGETINDLVAGFGDLLLIGNVELVSEKRNLPTVFAESFIKIPTASKATQISTGKIDFGLSFNIEKTIFDIISSAKIGYWFLGNPEGHTLKNPVAVSLSIGKEIQRDKYSIFLMYEGYSKIVNNYTAPKELSLLLRYFISSNTILSIKASTGLSSSSPDFFFVSKFDFNI